MLANRTASGDMIPNPDKFPSGFKAVADAIHALGLKSGLYTAKGTHTVRRARAAFHPTPLHPSLTLCSSVPLPSSQHLPVWWLCRLMWIRGTGCKALGYLGD